MVYRQPQRIVRFAALGPDGETALLGLPGQDPAGYLRPAVDGLYTLVYESNTARSELDGPAFTRYLHEEGLDSVLAARATRGEEDQPGRERYARALKSLVVVGEAAAAWDRPRGLALELVLEGDPNHVPANGELAFQLLYHGAPLAGALVGCQPVGAAEEATARSDGEGRVRFPVVAGTWMVSAVHMVPKSVDDADWMSVWTSLTFQLSPAPPSGETR